MQYVSDSSWRVWKLLNNSLSQAKCQSMALPFLQWLVELVFLGHIRAVTSTCICLKLKCTWLGHFLLFCASFSDSVCDVFRVEVSWQSFRWGWSILNIRGRIKGYWLSSLPFRKAFYSAKYLTNGAPTKRKQVTRGTSGRRGSENLNSEQTQTGLKKQFAQNWKIRDWKDCFSPF